MPNSSEISQYEAFWADQSSVSFLWLSILFSLCYIGASIAHQIDNSAVQSSAPPTGYLKRAAQALMAGKFVRNKAGSVEALLVYGIALWMFKREDSDTDAWLVMGLAVRMAMRQGYHRDPRHLKSITPFHAEMRRRVFCTISTFDLLLSFQQGLPPIILDEQVDTEVPSNLYDEDFDENTAVLPPSRPLAEPTPMLYYCTKFAQAKVLRRVMQHALHSTPPPYEKTLSLDSDVRGMHASIPSSLQVEAIDASCSSEGFQHRLNMEILYLKSLCVLHRPYLSHARANPRFEYSRRTCVNAAMRMLQYQAEVHAACQPGGRFEHEKWLLSNLTMQDFLLAAMIVCLDLSERSRAVDSKPDGALGPALSGTARVIDDAQARHAKLTALHTSHRIWASRQSRSRDARRASRIIAAMLLRLEGRLQQPEQVDAMLGGSTPKSEGQSAPLVDNTSNGTPMSGSHSGTSVSCSRNGASTNASSDPEPTTTSGDAATANGISRAASTNGLYQAPLVSSTADKPSFLDGVDGAVTEVPQGCLDEPEMLDWVSGMAVPNYT